MLALPSWLTTRGRVSVVENAIVISPLGSAVVHFDPNIGSELLLLRFP
jgi:hypothetical protein